MRYIRSQADKQFDLAHRRTYCAITKCYTNHSRLSQPEAIDERNDSPMREEVSLLEEDTQLNGTSPHGLPSNGKDHTSSGFTAVNGDSNKYAVSRSDDYHKHKMPQYREISQPLSAAAVAQHTWRPSERTDLEQDHHLIELESAEKTKRKRLEIDTTDAIRQDQPYATGQYSPKRRMTLPEDDDDPESPHRSAQALNSYGSDHRPTTTPVGVYTR